MSSPHWFKEELLSADTKALGVYTALLFLFYGLSKNSVSTFSDMEINKMLQYIRLELMKFLTGGSLHEASRAAEEFLNSIRESRTSTDTLLRELEDIEALHYSKFRKACYTFFRGVNEKYLDKIRKLLENLPFITTRFGTFGIRMITKSGTLVLKYLKYSFREASEVDIEIELYRLARELHRAGILFYFEDYLDLDKGGVIPAPYLEREFIQKMLVGGEAKPVATTAQMQVAGTPSPSFLPARAVERRKGYVGRKPAREILEAIVRDVLEDLGFKAETNVRLRTRGGGEVEVDVWAYKTAPRFYVYVSCKNWDKEVDRTVVDQESGRTLNLIQIPHLRILVAKRLSDSARREALADGFIVIELGEKASTENAAEIYDHIYTKLKELFTSIAPPELQQLAFEVKRIAENLREIAKRLETASG